MRNGYKGKTVGALCVVMLDLRTNLCVQVISEAMKEEARKKFRCGDFMGAAKVQNVCREVLYINMAGKNLKRNYSDDNQRFFLVPAY